MCLGRLTPARPLGRWRIGWRGGFSLLAGFMSNQPRLT
jgi:hypothetical protein